MNQWESVSQRDQSERIGTLERGRVCRVEPEGNGTTAAGAARAIISKWSTGTSREYGGGDGEGIHHTATRDDKLKHTGRLMNE